jgi:hypothetical protein
MEIVDAIAQRDAGRAVQLVHDYHSKIIKRTRSLPKAQELRESDPGLTTTLSLGANVGVSGLRSNSHLSKSPKVRSEPVTAEEA